MNRRALDHSELLTIAEKDEQYYRRHVGDEIQELAQRCLGTRKWIQMRGAITVLSRFGYFAVTTLSNIPTPGEEFCQAHLPRFDWVRNLLMVALNNEIRWPKEVSKFFVNYIQEIHLITFFLFGDFYEIAKRVTNFSYTTSDTNVYQSGRIKILNRTLGLILIAQLMLKISKQPPTPETTLVSKDELREVDARPSDDMVCHLCCAARSDPTSTLCGHIFCWNCIHQWLKERSECPICKTPTEPSRLIHLINFV